MSRERVCALSESRRGDGGERRGMRQAVAPFPFALSPPLEDEGRRLRELDDKEQTLLR